MMHYPKSRAEWLALRHQYVSSTEVAALFGLSPYTTAFELAVIKKGELPDEREGNERMEWGIVLQHAIAKRIAVKYGVNVRAISGYSTHSLQHCRMGSSFDYQIVGITADEISDDYITLRDMYEAHGAGILEIKNVDWLAFKDWPTGDDGEIEAPAHIEIQVQHQLACIGRTWGAIGVLVGGNKMELLVRKRDDEVHKALTAKCEKFWRDLAANIMPPVELPADAAIIGKLYKYAEPGKVLDKQGDAEIAAILHAYKDAAAAKKAAEAAQDTAKAQLLMKIGDAEKVLADGFTVSAGVVAETEIEAYTRKAYRNVRITAKKATKEKAE
jgi:putative phage-type endonuclease